MNRIKLLENSNIGLSNVLLGFDPQYSADDEIAKEIKHLSEAPPSFFVDEYHLEQNILDVSNLLDRILITRKDLWEIEALRQKLALGYISTFNQVEAEAQLSIAAASSENLESVKKACERKILVAKQSIEALESRHSQAGGALNFSERIDKIRNGLRNDVESCHVRTNAITEGLRKRYEIDFPRPDPDRLTYAKFGGAAHLDDWVSWHRLLSRKVESIQAKTSIFQTVIPLATPILIEFSPELTFVTKEKIKTLSPNLIEEIKKPHGEATFSLEGYDLRLHDIPDPGFEHIIPQRFGRTSILELALQVDVTPASQKEGWQFQVIITPPFAEAPIGINVDTLLPQPSWHSSPTIAHRPPEGIWKIQFLFAANNSVPAKQVARTEWPITDIKLLMRLEGTF